MKTLLPSFLFLIIPGMVMSEDQPEALFEEAVLGCLASFEDPEIIETNLAAAGWVFGKDGWFAWFSKPDVRILFGPGRSATRSGCFVEDPFSFVKADSGVRAALQVHDNRYEAVEDIDGCPVYLLPNNIEITFLPGRDTPACRTTEAIPVWVLVSDLTPDAE